MFSDEAKPKSQMIVRFNIFSKYISLPSIKRTDISLVIFLCLFSFTVSIIFLQNYGLTMMYYDSYKYLATAIAMAHGTTFDKMPFIIYLSLLYPWFSDPTTALFSLRVVNIVFTSVLIVFFYLIGRKMFDPFISVIGASFALFIPLVTSFSITLHNDIFTLAMAFVSLYFSIKPRKLSSVIVASIFIAITALTRLDYGLVFIIPYMIGTAYYLQSRTGLKIHLLLGIIIVVFFVPVYFVIQYIGGGQFYAVTLFEHNILKQVITFVNFDTIKTTIQSALEITGNNDVGISGNDDLNNIFLVFLLAGFGFFIYKNHDKILKILSIESIQLNEPGWVISYLAITAFISILTLTAFHFDFSIVDDSIKISSQIEQRYTLGLKLFILYGFMCGISLIMRLSYLNANKISVHNEYMTTKVSSKGKRNDPTINSHGVNFAELMQHRTKTSTMLIFLYGGLVVLIILAFAYAMWDTSVRFYQNYSTQLQVYYLAERWISENLGENEKAFLPMRPVFLAINPNLEYKTYDFRVVYNFHNGTKIPAPPIITKDEVLIVRQNFENFIHNDSNHIKYVVIDWVDPYGKAVTGLNVDNLGKNDVCKKFDVLTEEVKQFSFRLPYSDWGSSMIICKV